MMGQNDEVPLYPLAEAEGLPPMIPVAAECAVRPVVAADRLYQLAAVTAGIILLATLL